MDDQFKRIIRLQLDQGHYAAVATHDERILEYVRTYVHEQGISNQAFEFQMLYGIRPQLQQQLAAEGYTVRVYVPYGTQWYGYFMRRMAERPENLTFVLKSIFRR
ncbi:Proline dehydrogenase 1 [compost metagenome]